MYLESLTIRTNMINRKETHRLDDDADQSKTGSNLADDELFEKALHRHQIKGIKSKIKKLRSKSIKKNKSADKMRKHRMQQQITLVLLIMTLIWFFMLIAMWL